MNYLKFPYFIMLASLVATVAAAINGLIFTTLISGSLTFLLVMAGTQDVGKNRVRAAKAAFEELKVFALNKHWIGSSATVAKVSNLLASRERMGKPWGGQVLAIAKGGTWFTVNLIVTGIEKVKVLHINPLNETTAKTLLGADLEVYEKFFGKPDVA